MRATELDRTVAQEAPSSIEFTTSVERLGSRVVRVIPPNPVSAQVALHAFRNGDIAGVVTLEDLRMMLSIESTVSKGLSCVSETVFALAGSSPPLTDRQCELLSLVARGLSNEMLAEVSHCSVSTLKRELSVLLRSIRAPRSAVSVLLAVTSESATGPEQRYLSD